MSLKDSDVAFCAAPVDAKNPYALTSAFCQSLLKIEVEDALQSSPRGVQEVIQKCFHELIRSMDDFCRMEKRHQPYPLAWEMFYRNIKPSVDVALTKLSEHEEKTGRSFLLSVLDAISAFQNGVEFFHRKIEEQTYGYRIGSFVRYA